MVDQPPGLVTLLSSPTIPLIPHTGSNYEAWVHLTTQPTSFASSDSGWVVETNQAPLGDQNLSVSEVLHAANNDALDLVESTLTGGSKS